MLGLPQNTFVFCTAALVLLGAFSRFTHGKYTPQYYAYQEYHQVDDGSNIAKIVPVMDVILGSLAIRRGTRLIATGIIDAFMVMGMFIQITNGKRFELDVLTVVIASLAVIEAA